jgi:hypothetical protein
MDDALESWSSAIPETLVNTFRSATPPIVFLGSGFGREALPALPTGIELASELCRELGVVEGGISLPELLQFYKNREVGSAPSVRQWLESKLHHAGPTFAEPGGAYHLLLTLPGRQILTTNFDLLLDRAAARILPSAKWRKTSDPQKYAEYLETTDTTTKVCGMVHGSFDPTGTADIIATTDDYAKEFVERRWQNAIENAVRHHRIIFIGYSLRDFTTWSSFISSILLYPSEIWPKYLVSPHGSEHDKKFWAKYHVDHISLKAYQFVAALHERLGTLATKRNPVYAAAAHWQSDLDTAESKVQSFHAARHYPTMDYTLRAILKER